MEFNDVIKKSRKQFSNFMLKTNSIDRLFTDKVEDYILLEELPLPILVGKKTIYIGNFVLDNEQEFFQGWALIISALSARIINYQLADDFKKELVDKCGFEMLGDGKYMLEFLWRDKQLNKQIMKLLKKTLLKEQKRYVFLTQDKVQVKKWNNCSYRYFKKYMTRETLIQICYMIWLYNFDSQKKSLRLLVEKMGIHSQVETYIPFWLQNMGGLTGEFLKHQVENIDYFCGDLESKEHQEAVQRAKEFKNESKND